MLLPLFLDTGLFDLIRRDAIRHAQTDTRSKRSARPSWLQQARITRETSVTVYCALHN